MPPSVKVEKGYVTLQSAWLKVNPRFRLRIPFCPRLTSPHPNTKQDIAIVARGPLIYCLEDVDNPLVDDYFKACGTASSCNIY
jgi:DUF1680 family protein